MRPAVECLLFLLLLVSAGKAAEQGHLRDDLTTRLSRSSCQLAAQEGPYETYEGSPMSKGHLAARHVGRGAFLRGGPGRSSRESIAKHGVRNSLLVAPMPTASTSQILGNNECFGPYTSNIYTRAALRSVCSPAFWHSDPSRSAAPLTIFQIRLLS